MSYNKEYQLSVHVWEKIQNIHNSNELDPELRSCWRDLPKYSRFWYYQIINFHGETFVELGIILDYFNEMVIKFVC